MTSRNEFLNPYNFIPVNDEVQTEDASSISRGYHSYIRHDVWQPDALHGRIKCTLDVETPMVIGGSYNRRNEDQTTPTIQQPYRRRHAAGKDELAIPGNSLRGVIGSTLEALSNSTLRVLKDGRYSMRKNHNKALNMIGFLSWNEDNEAWELVPCAVTSLRSKHGGNAIANSKKYKAVFRKRSGEPAALDEILPAYVDNVESSFDSGDWAYARLKPIHARTVDRIDQLTDQGNLQGLKVKRGTILGRIIEGSPLKESAYEELPAEKKAAFRCGALRILGRHDHPDEVQNRNSERDLPPTKKHEYFIPVPLLETGEEDYCAPLPIPPRVINRFEEMARQRRKQDQRLPFNLKGLKAGDGLQNHQYLYFDAQEEKVDGELKWVVSEISISAIWREPVSLSIHEFFGRISDNLLPWSGQRGGVTPAEALLGCVSSGTGDDEPSLPALASRVRFRDALLTNSQSQNAVLGEEIKLQILATPKPPSPSLYFRFPKSTSAVAKENLAKKNPDALPRGRKWYLHHKLSNDAAPWKSRTGADDDGNKQRICATPIVPGTRFSFSIEFTNLSYAELELLCVALCPSGNYRHKLGLGKPLGLGTVAISIDRISIEDRGFTAYSPVSLEETQLPAKDYNTLAELAGTLAQGENRITLIDEEIRGILETIGDPENVTAPVCYPRSASQLKKWLDDSGAQEEKLFEWFVNNDSQATPQALAPVEKEKPLKTLRANVKA